MQSSTRMEYLRQAGERHEESLGEMLTALANQSAGLVRDEVALAKQELQEKFTSLRAAVMVIAAGAIVGLIAALALCAAAILALAQVVGAWQAALIVGAALAVIAGVVVWIGLGKLRRTSLKPEKTLQTLEEDKEWLKELT
ncbi:MAG TPA: phage holin family protein [Blastocatellia bacterium]|nr:phage holin family protein [Blastocatellia bacterium]